jgi:hypothetical protein
VCTAGGSGSGSGCHACSAFTKIEQLYLVVVMLYLVDPGSLDADGQMGLQSKTGSS